jgi:hypothetical protein
MQLLEVSSCEMRMERIRVVKEERSGRYEGGRYEVKRRGKKEYKRGKGRG